MYSVLEAIEYAGGREDLLLVVFVHGWKHSAAAADDNIQLFRQALGNLSSMEQPTSRQAGKEPRKVVGVYLGWRGGAVSAPWVKRAHLLGSKEDR